MSKISPDDVILYHESNVDWITDESNKKYLITDDITVTEFKFETVSMKYTFFFSSPLPRGALSKEFTELVLEKKS